MTPDQFCYWLQGLLELMPDLKTLDEKQLAMVRAHLGYVFEHGHLDSGKRIADLFAELAKKPAPLGPLLPPQYGPNTAPGLDLMPRVIC